MAKLYLVHLTSLIAVIFSMVSEILAEGEVRQETNTKA